ncbi:hypothetical protein JXL21_03140 [Candidatus Bathyarchaeota archaeon]|nr:hypothetical protein [Candidatus Bathyarchaeota archaeon]
MTAEPKEEEVQKLEDQKEKIREVSFAYKMYVFSRRDFLLGIAIGITGSLTAAYLVELDRVLFQVARFTPVEVVVRILGLSLALGYVVHRYRQRTSQYEESMRKMSERMDEINGYIETLKGDKPR